MLWKPGKLEFLKWDSVPPAPDESESEISYDMLVRYWKAGPRKRYKYVLVSVSLLRLITKDGAISCCAAEIRYQIRPEDEEMTLNFLLSLVMRTHLLFADAFEKRKKNSGWSSYEIPDPDLAAISKRILAKAKKC